MSTPAVTFGCSLLPSIWADPPSIMGVRARMAFADLRVLRIWGSAFSSHLLRTPKKRSSQKAPWTNLRLCEVAHLGHRSRAARHGSVVRATGCFGTHVSLCAPPTTNVPKKCGIAAV
jgi:hypothetical protein